MQRVDAYAVCVSVSVCAFIIKPSSAQGETQRDGEREGDGAMGAEPSAVAAVVDCQIHVAFHAFQLSCS